MLLAERVLNEPDPALTNENVEAFAPCFKWQCDTQAWRRKRREFRAGVTRVDFSIRPNVQF